MSTVTVWRVEFFTTKKSVDGSDEGVFTDGLLHDFMSKYCNSNGKALPEYPTPRKDIGIERWPHEYEKCACESIDSLRHWFGDKAIIKQLTKHDVVIRKLKVPADAVVFGQTQVIYDHTKAQVLDTYPVKQLFELSEAD